MTKWYEELGKLPIVDPDPEATAKLTRDMLIQEGRAAYRLGVRLFDCPPFRDQDLRINWQNGWRWERDGE